MQIDGVPCLECDSDYYFLAVISSLWQRKAGDSVTWNRNVHVHVYGIEFA